MRVEPTRSALNDLAAIYTSYQERDYEHAERVVRAIMGACDGLAQFPLMGRIGKVEGTRERLMTRYPYRIVYRIAGETIFVARIVGQRRQWPPEGSEA